MITLYDTTLRDGAQTTGVSFSLQDKLSITEELDKFGIDYIEGGWPYSNPTDREYFSAVRKLPLRSKIAAFGMTARFGADKDANLAAMIESDPDVFTIFGKSWDLHVRDVLGKDLDSYLQTIAGSVKRLKRPGKLVIYDAEHFFDGYKENSSYALRTLEAAADAGADMLALCDTNGGCLPKEICSIISDVMKRASVPLGIHCHNDGGLALANTLAAMDAGCAHVQGTINGLGERCGNLDLNDLVYTLSKNNDSYAGITARWIELARHVERLSRIKIDSRKPYIGSDAFAHKGGVHADAVAKIPKAYEHMNPYLIGNERKFPLSEQSGRAAVVEMARAMGYHMDKNHPMTEYLLGRINSNGEEVGNAQFYLMIREFEGWKDPFRVHRFRTVNTDYSNPEATVKLEINGNLVHSVAEGDGEVNALDNALRNALHSRYPRVEDVSLTDYEVSLPKGERGTEAEVVVQATFVSDGHQWTSIRRSADQTKAGFEMLVDSYKYYIAKMLSDKNV